MPDVRVLRPGDEAALDAFLATYAETSMFLRANARSAGLTDRGEPMQAIQHCGRQSSRFDKDQVAPNNAHFCWQRTGDDFASLLGMVHRKTN